MDTNDIQTDLQGGKLPNTKYPVSCKEQLHELPERAEASVILKIRGVRGGGTNRTPRNSIFEENQGSCTSTLPTYNNIT